jgi:hypothetical protein
MEKLDDMEEVEGGAVAGREVSGESQGAMRVIAEIDGNENRAGVLSRGEQDRVGPKEHQMPVGAVKDFRGDASHQQLLEAFPAVSSHRDEIRVPASSFAQDGLVGLEGFLECGLDLDHLRCFRSQVF